MKQSLTILACSTMALTIFTSTATANPAVHTPASIAADAKVAHTFNDLSNIDTALKAKIDALVSKQIFEGVSSDIFGINQTMTRAQFAKVAALVFELKVDYSIKTSSFVDVKANDLQNSWAIPYIEAAKRAGLIDGITDTEFAPGENVTIGQLDKVFVTGLGKKVKLAGIPWYEDAVKQARDLGIHPVGKEGNTAATRADLVVAAYGSSEAYEKQNSPAPASIVSVQAADDNKMVQVTFNQAVESSKATLSLKKGAQSISTSTHWSSDRKSAHVTIDAALSSGEYTIVLNGLDKPVTASLTITGKISTNDPHVTITNPGDIANVMDSGLTNAASGLNGLVSKSTAEDPTVSKFAKEIKFNVTNAAGEKVAIPGIIESITSSDPGVLRVARSNDKRGYVLGNKAGTAIVNIVFKTNTGESKRTTVTMNVKSDSVTASRIEADTRTNQRMTVTNNVYSAAFNAYSAMNLKVGDNYGIEYQKDEVQKYNFALAVLIIPEHIVGDPDHGAVGTVTIDPDGTVHVTGNVTQFDLTAYLPNNKSVSTEVQLQR
ncbi:MULTISPECIES: S-layer homology domain-containing protein [unclassified Paenibacillus]|uniref:S-layer homology domain-containing protein n=1 Tax=unclassified Paenibacillus TaxID=185978 RepID=UPI001AE987B0|nr:MULTISPECIES: S-layer homology domain-containing protein [unclassified Paenibacillus]MBP1155692.1 hypothetical protein [Paenibacillus sp. PvP091]MBP1168922.1 hypothetical protein [Paenibacillus sp. PvR098]MBP2439950.1 hypothetical protein [Paenibacillus sp. PvP052]